MSGRIHFDTHGGLIWLDDQRMLLQHASSMRVLRHELIKSLGADKARGLITRVGYNAGSNDAEIARKFFVPGTAGEAVLIGPLLHMLEGIGRVVTRHTDFDVERGRFIGEFEWHSSAEGEEHVRLYGIGSDAACWQQVAYASGFVSQFLGRPVLFKETQCIAQGAKCCVLLGKPVEDWHDADDEIRALRADDLSSGLSVPAPRTALPGATDVVGVSAGFNAVCHMIRRTAPTLSTVLFLGESGVGKEVLAQALHSISQRASGPFVALNCAALPEELVESELFGVEKGAYTGVQTSRPGRFERADGGTLFLDEIGILSWPAQGKLLRALQEREIERLGATCACKVDVRVVAATNLDLRDAVRTGRFREDLFFRLNVLPIRVPPLRERREDIPVFMNHFLRKFNRRDGRNVTGFTGRAIDAMLAYHWPGNIRELENLVERGVVLASDGGAIDTLHLFMGGEEFKGAWLALNHEGGLDDDDPSRAPLHAADGRGLGDRIAAMLGDQPDIPPLSLDAIERALIERAIERTRGNQSAAARLLGISRAQLIYRLKAGRQAAGSSADAPRRG